jgi:hypothetical protein
VYKYADRGFGIRILPEYIRTLHPKLIHFWKTSGYTKRRVRSEDKLHSRTLLAAASPEKREKFRLINGYKVLEAVQFYAYDFAERVYVGKTKRSVYEDECYEEKYEFMNKKEDDKREVDIGVFDGRQNSGDTPHGWQGMGGFELVMRHHAIWEMEKKGLLEYAFLPIFFASRLSRINRRQD